MQGLISLAMPAGINTILSQFKQPAARPVAQQTAQAAATQKPTVPQELTSAVLWCLLVAMEDTSVSGAVRALSACQRVSCCHMQSVVSVPTHHWADVGHLSLPGRSI